MDATKLKNILEAGLLVAGRTLSVAQLEALFEHDEEKPERKQIKEALESLKEDYNGRGIELVEVASGYRLQSHESVSDYVANLFQEKTPRYSRALLETLVLIAYRQPITRAEIEEVRGVAVSSNIIKTLQERQWVKVLGHKEVPGRPALLGTTKEFLDYFNLKKLDDLPSLAEIKDLDQFDELLAEEVGEVDEQGDAANDAGSDLAAGDAAPTDGNSDQSTDIILGTAEPSIDGDDANESAGDVGSASDSDSINDDNSESAQLESGSVWDLGAKPDTEQDADVDGHSNDAADNDAPDDEADEEGAPEHNETLSGPELELLRVISDFSDEHQQEVDARDEMEAGIGSKTEEDKETIDVGDLSQRVGDDRKSGDMPEPGDTLH